MASCGVNARTTSAVAFGCLVTLQGGGRAARSRRDRSERGIQARGTERPRPGCSFGAEPPTPTTERGRTKVAGSADAEAVCWKQASYAWNPVLDTAGAVHASCETVVLLGSGESNWADQGSLERAAGANPTQAPGGTSPSGGLGDQSGPRGMRGPGARSLTGDRIGPARGLPGAVRGLLPRS